MKLVNGHMVRQNIKDAQERTEKRKREESVEESDVETPSKRCRFIGDEAKEAESDEEVEGVWDGDIMTWSLPPRRWSLGYIYR